MGSRVADYHPPPEIVLVQQREEYMGLDHEDYKGSGVQFTRPDDTVIYINPRAVAYVRAPLSHEHGNAVIVFSNGAIQQVKETVEQVIRGIHLDMPMQKE